MEGIIQMLTFSLSCAGSLFQAKSDEIFSDMRDFAHGIADDIIVIGFKKDGSDHNAALEAVCACTNNVNLCLNDKKVCIALYHGSIFWWVSL